VYTVRFDSIDQIGWEAIEPMAGSTLDFSYGLLRAVERSLWGDLSVRYVAVEEDNAVVAFTPVYIGTNLNFNALLPRLLQRGYSSIVNSLGAAWGYSVAIVGCLMSDRGWIPMHPDCNAREVVALMLPEIERVARADGADFCIIKDILHNFPEIRQFVSAGYVQAHSLPAISVATPFSSFEAYLQSRSKNGRKHARKNFRKATESKLHLSTFKDFADLVPVIYPFFRQTFLKAQFQLEELSPAFFRECDASTHPQSEVVVCEKDGCPVGAIMILYNSRELQIKRVGIDYSQEDSGLIYNMMMYEGMKRAIELGIPNVSLGQSTYIPKMRLGGQMENVFIFLKGFSFSLHAGFPAQKLWLARYSTDRMTQALAKSAEE